MTQYEKLIKKATACREAAKRTSGYMSTVWQIHADTLEAKANALTIKQAEKKEEF